MAPMGRKTTAAGAILLAAIMGVMAVELISNRPVRLVPEPSTGRVCPAFHFFTRPPGPLLYYTTDTPCTVSWSFVLVGLAAAMYLLASRR